MMIEKDEFKLAEFERFEKLKPFGQGFARPTFMINQGRIRSLRQVGKDKNHIKITFQDISIDTIGFNFGHLFHEVAVGDKISLVGTVNINEFNQNRSLQMIIQDAEISNVQIIDMRSRVSQNFDMISSDDHFLSAATRRRRAEITSIMGNSSRLQSIHSYCVICRSHWNRSLSPSRIFMYPKLS